MNTSRKTYTIIQRQHGAVFIVMLVFLIMGVAAFLVSSLNSNAVQIQRDQKTADALAQAKEALIGYAVTYGDTHPAVNGFLPCPDQGQNVVYDGEANSSCGTKNISSIGKLPWKTLGLSTPKDGNTECLWYVVSGTYKNSSPTDIMNWDNIGLLQVMASDGVSFLAGSTADNSAVAVIIAPGTALASQSHSPAAATPSCGGNYTASNYLDNDTVHSINNANISPTANVMTQFVTGLVKDASNNTVVNDRVIFISRNDIFNAIKKRNDFVTFVSTLLSNTTTCMPAFPTPLPAPITIDFSSPNLNSSSESAGTTIGSLITGRIPYSACTNTLVRQWRDNLLYAACSSGSACLTVNGSGCRGVVIFSGERTSLQTRVTNIEKNTWSNYLEDVPSANLTAFNNGTTTFTGASTYSAASPSTDVLACIP